MRETEYGMGKIVSFAMGKNSASWPTSQECNSPFLTGVVRKLGAQKLSPSIYQVTSEHAVCAQAEGLLCANTQCCHSSESPVQSGIPKEQPWEAEFRGRN